MSTFKFESGVKTLDITNDKDEVIKTYRVNVGRKEELQKWSQGLRGLQENLAKLDRDDPKAFDELETMMKDIINAIVGDWDYLWQLCDHNIFSMAAFAKHLSTFVNDAMKEMYEGLV